MSIFALLQTGESSIDDEFVASVELLHAGVRTICPAPAEPNRLQVMGLISNWQLRRDKRRWYAKAQSPVAASSLYPFNLVWGNVARLNGMSGGAAIGGTSIYKVSWDAAIHTLTLDTPEALRAFVHFVHTYEVLEREAA